MLQTLTRQWELPKRRPFMRMTWHDLLFMHWPVDVVSLRKLMPERLEVDTFEGQAWIAVVPFHMSGVAPVWSPNLPGMSAFPELNVRTYVRDPLDKNNSGKPGVWFFSLDATNPVAVRGARWLFNLNYVDAKIRVKKRSAENDSQADWVDYSSRRRNPKLQAELVMSYRPVGGLLEQQSDLEAWMTSRYCMYSSDRRGRILRGEIDHQPWPLQKAECNIGRNTMTDWLGVKLPDLSPMVHFSRSIDVLAWSMDRIDQVL